MPLVRRIARRMAWRAPSSIVTDDLVAAGALGLVDSIRRNGGDHGDAFGFYMLTRIRGSIQDELRASDWLPRGARVRAAEGHVSGQPRPVAVIRFDDLPPGPEASPPSSDPAADPHEVLARKRVINRINSAVTSLPARDQLILRLHYSRGMQLKEIGRLLGVSEARISQLHHRALDRIRPRLAPAA